MLTTIILVLLVLMLVGSLPTWNYSAGWAFGPTGIIVLLLVLWLIFGSRLSL